MLDPRSYAFLKDETTNRVYEIQWQPAIIGRPTNEAEHNIMLAVNLQLHPLGQTVSRTHAQIIFSKGSFFVEALAENNPLSVNGKPVPVNARREIKNGDRLILGRNNLSMTFNTQDLPAAPAAQARVQPAPQPVRQPPAPQAAAQPAPVIQPARQPAPAVEERTYVAPPAPASAPAGAASQPAHLVIERALTANKLGQRLDIPPGAFLLGRELPLLMGEGEISRRHAELNFDTRVNQYTITDLGSTNGVTLNGVRIDPNRPYSISNGTRIGLGANFLLRFEI